MLFRDLSTSAQIVYHVTRRIKNHQTNAFFHSIETLMQLTGKGESTVRRGLNDLVKYGILKRTERIGHTTLYTFISEALLSDVTPVRNETPLLSHLTPHPRTSDTHNNSDLTDSDLTTTDLQLKSYNDLIRLYGKDVVDVAVVNCKKLNGEVRNFWGLVRWSCKTGIPPTNKASLQAEAKEKHIKFIEEETEKVIAERERWEKAQENADPDLPNNIIADFLSKHED